jgi:hypothetical protein
MMHTLSQTEKNQIAALISRVPNYFIPDEAYRCMLKKNC